MEDEKKTKKQLIEELNELRKCSAELKSCKAEINQLRSDQEKFTKAFLQSSVPATISTLKEGRFVEVNNAYLALTRRKRDEVIGRTSIEVGAITKEQRSLIINELNKNGRVENLEMVIGTKSGASHNGLLNSVMMNIADKKYLLTVMTDITGLRQAEEALKEKEEMLSLISKNMSDMIRVTDVQGVNLYASPSHLAGLGYRPEERLGKTGFDIAHPDDLPMLNNEFAKGLAGTEPMKRVEYRVKHADGYYIWLDTIVNILRDDQGQVKTIVMCSRDISERKQAESQREAALELLAKSEEKYRSFFENAIQGMYQSTVDGRYLSVNPAFAKMHGFATPAEMISSVTDIATQIYRYPEEREKLKKIIMDQGVLKNYEVKRLRKDGQVTWQLLNAHLVRDSKGNVLMVEGTCIDITDRKRTEEMLVKSEEKYRTITENIMDCIVLEDAKGVFQYVINCQEILGYKPEEMIGKTGLSFCHPDERTRELNHYQGAVGKEWHEIIYETRIRHKNGHYVPIEVNTRALRDEQGEFIGAVCAARDSAHHRRMVKELFHASKPSSTSPILSPREKEIIGWVMQGKSTWDIAKILDISERTVKFHIDSTMKKLSAVNRTHAVAIALRDDLI